MKDTPEKYLRELIAAVEAHIAALDREMRTSLPTVDRGKRIVALVNHLELQKDIAKRYGIKEIEKGRPVARTAKREARPSSDR